MSTTRGERHKYKEQLGHIQKKVVEEETCLSRGTDRRLREGTFFESTIRRPTTCESGHGRVEEDHSCRKETIQEIGKAVRGFWDGSNETDGRSRCSVVIKGVDKDKWITIRKNCSTADDLYGHGS